jgi:hypothetical protein
MLEQTMLMSELAARHADKAKNSSTLTSEFKRVAKRATLEIDG